VWSRLTDHHYLCFFTQLSQINIGGKLKKEHITVRFFYYLKKDSVQMLPTQQTDKVQSSKPRHIVAPPAGLPRIARPFMRHATVIARSTSFNV
jgi:hypothetical protein